MQQDFFPKLSIITVVFNNVRDLQRTMDSVFQQRYQNIEYIVIDGGSTDGTRELIQRSSARISRWVSEKDKGIYDAMNKGLQLCSGDYVLFMNSGDELYDEYTVERVFSTQAGADIYYGETEMYDSAWRSLGRRRHRAPRHFNWKSFRYGMNVSHQAIYIKKSLTGPYDLRYKLSADIDWILRAAKKATLCVRVPGYLAKYLVGGMSKQKHWESLQERFIILSRYYGFFPNLFNHTVIALRLLLSVIVRKKAHS